MTLAAAALAAAAGSLFVAWPLPAGLLERRPAPAIRFADRTGRLLREVRSRADGRSVPLPRGEPVPPLVRAAILAAEDRRFDVHPGVDPLAATRAAGQVLVRRRIVSGASTVPMQLARQVVPSLAPHRRTLGAKLTEALWALRLSAQVPREELLRAYLDRVYLGNGVYGIEAAALTYFERPARTLSLGQAALLAGLIAVTGALRALAPRVRDARPDGARPLPDLRPGPRLERGRRPGPGRPPRPRAAAAAVRGAAPRRRAGPRPARPRPRGRRRGRDDHRPGAPARRGGDPARRARRGSAPRERRRGGPRQRDGRGPRLRGVRGLPRRGTPGAERRRPRPPAARVGAEALRLRARPGPRVHPRDRPLRFGGARRGGGRRLGAAELRPAGPRTGPAPGGAPEQLQRPGGPARGGARRRGRPEGAPRRRVRLPERVRRRLRGGARARERRRDAPRARPRLPRPRPGRGGRARRRGPPRDGRRRPPARAPARARAAPVPARARRRRC